MRDGSLHVPPRARVVVEFGKSIHPAALDRAGEKDMERIVYKEFKAMKDRHVPGWHGTRHR